MNHPFFLPAAGLSRYTETHLLGLESNPSQVLTKVIKKNKFVFAEKNFYCFFAISYQCFILAVNFTDVKSSNRKSEFIP